MKVTNLDTSLVNFYDKEMQDSDGRKMTVRGVVMTALANHNPLDVKDGGVSVKHKERCYDLMIAVKMANGEVDLESDDVVLIKERLNTMFPPVIVGQVCKFLEGKVTNPSKVPDIEAAK